MLHPLRMIPKFIIFLTADNGRKYNNTKQITILPFNTILATKTKIRNHYNYCGAKKYFVCS